MVKVRDRGVGLWRWGREGCMWANESGRVGGHKIHHLGVKIYNQDRRGEQVCWPCSSSPAGAGRKIENWEVSLGYIAKTSSLTTTRPQRTQKIKIERKGRGEAEIREPWMFTKTMTGMLLAYWKEVRKVGLRSCLPQLSSETIWSSAKFWIIKRAWGALHREGSAAAEGRTQDRITKVRLRPTPWEIFSRFCKEKVLEPTKWPSLLISEK